MVPKSIALVLCPVAVVLFALISPARSIASKPTWCKKGVTFPVGCSRSFKGCRPLRIPSPDGKSVVNITYSKTPEYPDVEVASLRVTTLGKVVGEVQPVDDVEDELTWSPDSEAFFINGNNNDYGDEHIAVHRLDDRKLGPGNITREVEQDMLHSFPPCQAKNAINICAELEAKPEDYIGVVAVDWIGNSSKIVLMAEVPCSSSMGGIMCQVLGYELEVPSGKILRRMKPKEFARRWQHSMAWRFHDPGPPQFKTKTQSTPN